MDAVCASKTKSGTPISGLSMLQGAAACGHAALVDLLLARAANVNHQDSIDGTALMNAQRVEMRAARVTRAELEHAQ